MSFQISSINNSINTGSTNQSRNAFRPILKAPFDQKGDSVTFGAKSSSQLREELIKFAEKSPEEAEKLLENAKKGSIGKRIKDKIAGVFYTGGHTDPDDTIRTLNNFGG